MPSVFTQAQLQQLRAGDRVTYGGVQWQIANYSSYNDDNGYTTEEWLLKTKSSRSYYLLREIDPENPENRVNWYLSEEISGSSVSGERVGDNLQFTMWRVIRDGEQPYPHLQALGKDFYFESQTDGTYSSESGKASRTTWDYWDQEHLWNLAIEAWKDGNIHFYSTKKVNPQDFSEIIADVKKASLVGSRNNSFDTRKQNETDWQKIQIFMAWGLIIGGILFMLFGGW